MDNLDRRGVRPGRPEPDPDAYPDARSRSGPPTWMRLVAIIMLVAMLGAVVITALA